MVALHEEISLLEATLEQRRSKLVAEMNALKHRLSIIDMDIAAIDQRLLSVRKFDQMLLPGLSRVDDE